MYRELNDYETLYLICDGNDMEYEILLEKYQPLITKIINKYKYVVKKFGYEEEDLKQIGALTLYQTISGYNGNRNDNLFYTYFLKSLENAILATIKTNNNNKRKALNESISYDNKFPNSELTYADIFPDPKTTSLNTLGEIELQYSLLKNNLQFELSCILDLKVEGYKNNEIAILLDMSISDVYRSLKKIKEKKYYFTN